MDRCLWRKNGRIVNLYSEKYDLIGKKAAGDCSVRCEIQSIQNVKSWKVLSFRLKHAFRQNAGHYECSADLTSNGKEDLRWEETDIVKPWYQPLSAQTF